MMDYLDYATTATGIPITECDTCGQRHPVTRQHCSRCRSWSAFQRSGLCLICAEVVASQGVSRGLEGAEMGQMWENGGEHETAPTGELVPHQPGPDRDSTPLLEGGIVAEPTVPETDPRTGH